MNQASAVGIGVLISLMLMANGVLQSAFGAMPALVIIHAIGTVAVGAILLARRASASAKAGTGGTGISREVVHKAPVPRYLYLAGAVGVLLVFLNNTTVAVIGLTLTIAFGVVGQLTVSSVIDHYGFFGLEKRQWDGRKLIGLGLIAAGIVVMSRFGSAS